MASTRHQARGPAAGPRHARSAEAARVCHAPGCSRGLSQSTGHAAPRSASARRRRRRGSRARAAVPAFHLPSRPRGTSGLSPAWGLPRHRRRGGSGFYPPTSGWDPGAAGPVTGQQWRCPNRPGELTQAGIPLFAAAEPIDVADADATTILVRRVKQGAAECSSCRSEKARAGLQEHALRGFNNRPHPRRHQVAKIPHAGPPSVRKAAPRPGSASTLTAPPWSSRCSPGALRRAPGTGS